MTYEKLVYYKLPPIVEYIYYHMKYIISSGAYTHISFNVLHHSQLVKFSYIKIVYISPG